MIDSARFRTSRSNIYANTPTLSSHQKLGKHSVQICLVAFVCADVLSACGRPLTPLGKNGMYFSIGVLVL